MCVCVCVCVCVARVSSACVCVARVSSACVCVACVSSVCGACVSSVCGACVSSVCGACVSSVCGACMMHSAVVRVASVHCSDSALPPAAPLAPLPQGHGQFPSGVLELKTYTETGKGGTERERVE